MKTLDSEQISRFRADGYLVVRGVFASEEIADLAACYDEIAALATRTGLQAEYLQASGCEVHIHFQPPEGSGGPNTSKYLRKIQWPAMIHAGFERIRTSPRFLALLEPLLGDSLKQYINQINFKMPGGDIEFLWHQDVRPTPAFRDQVDNYVQTIIAVDDASVKNGCLHIIPGTHKLGDLNLRQYATDEEREQMLEVHRAVPGAARAGDVILFTSYSVHGSQPNRTQRPRRSYINGFVRASSCDVGKWAFLRGRPVPITSDHDYADIRLC